MLKKRKILHLVGGLDIGGTELQLLMLLPKLQKYFDNRVVCVRGRGPIGKELTKKGIPVSYLDMQNVFDLGRISRFGKACRKFSPDILVTYLIHNDLFGRIFGRIYGVKKIVCSQRGVLLQWEFLRKVDRLTKNLVTMYLIQTEVTKKRLMRELNLPEDKFYVIHNAIDTGRFKIKVNRQNKCAKLNLKSDNINLVCVGKLRRGKGHNFLLQAFENLYAQEENINLLLVGAGEKKDELAEQITNYKSKKNIYFLGDRNDVPEILKISDIFVLPTLGEGMSNALLEAMAAGLPIVSTDILQNREILVSGKTALLVPPQKSGELFLALKKLLDKPHLAKQLAENAQNEVEAKFALDRVVVQMTKFYNNL